MGDASATHWPQPHASGPLPLACYRSVFMLEILGKTNFDFMGKRKLSFAFSGFMVLLGLVAIVQIARGAANLGIDFAGGTAVQLKFDQPVRTDEARAALDRNNLHGAEIQEFVAENKLLI